MHIAVLAKVVPDYEVPLADFELAGRRAGARYTRMMGLYDENAIEVGVQLKAQTQARLSIVSMGPKDDVPVLRKALAMGGDALYLVDGHLEDPLGLALNLALALEQAGPVDLVLAGRQASDIERGLVPAFLAQRLGLPFINQVASVSRQGAGWLVSQSTEKGSCELAVDGPAVLSITSNEGNVPRIPVVRDIFAAKKKQVEILAQAPSAPMGLEEIALEVVRMESRCEVLPSEDIKAAVALLLQRLKEERYI